jgi:hypothetical protein
MERLTGLRGAHIRWHIACEEIFAGRRKDIDDFGVLRKDAFVLGIAGYHWAAR